MLRQMLSRVRAETPRATFGIKYLVKGPKQIQLWSSSKGTSQNSMTITSTLPLIMVKILPLFLTSLPKWWTTSKRPLIKNKKFVKTPGITKMIGSDFAKAGMISGVPLQNFQTPIFQTPRLILPRLVNVSTLLQGPRRWIGFYKWYLFCKAIRFARKCKNLTSAIRGFP